MKPMTGPLRRINRAKKHLNVLNREIKAFIASQPYRCAINIDQKDGSYILSPYLTRQHPIAWGLLVGEVAHGLRSALDNIAWTVAIKRTKNTVFPIHIKESPNFIVRLKCLRSDIWADVKAVQPYNRPDRERRSHPLWILSRIDNIDKHRIILPSATRITIATGLPSPNKFFFVDGFIRLNKGSIEFKIPKSPNLKKDFKPELTAKILFDISSPPIEPSDPVRLSLRDLFDIHHFVRYDVYPRFAKFLEPKGES